MKTYNTVSINGTPFEYEAMPTLSGTVVRFEGSQYLIPIKLGPVNKMFETLLSVEHAHKTLTIMEIN